MLTVTVATAEGADEDVGRHTLLAVAAGTDKLDCKSSNGLAVIRMFRDMALMGGRHMNVLLRFAAVAATGVIASTSLALAQNASIGQREYDNNCAVCHGVSGKGDGPMAGIIDQGLPDLTQLAKNNGGIFPVSRMYEVIDGRVEVGAHGTRDMPIWGDEYNAQAGEGLLGYYYTGGDVEAFVRGRVLALIEYISTLQEQ